MRETDGGIGLKHHFPWVVNDPRTSTLSYWTWNVFVLRLNCCGNILSLFWGDHASARKCRLDHCVTITVKDQRSRRWISGSIKGFKYLWTYINVITFVVCFIFFPHKNVVVFFCHILIIQEHTSNNESLFSLFIYTFSF